jgi:hypothetical protein
VSPETLNLAGNLIRPNLRQDYCIYSRGIETMLLRLSRSVQCRSRLDKMRLKNGT